MPHASPSNTPMQRWGKDHWSMLAYVETLCVDGEKGVGTIDKRRVRSNEKTHPLLAVNANVGGWKPQWGTRLKGYFDFAKESFSMDPSKAEEAGFQLPQHDDWDCLEDIQAAGLVNIHSLVNGFVQMTPNGLDVCAQLRAHKSNGGMFANFEPAEAAPARKPSL